MSGDLQALREKLRELVNKHAVVHGDFVLTSGQKSTYYIDGKLLSLMPDGLNQLAKVILASLDGEEVDAIGGMTLGADPIIGAVAAFSHEQGRPLRGLIVRKERSGHGRTKLVEGPLRDGLRVVVIEDVVTTGSSSIKAIAALEEAGCQIVKVIAIVDRLAGGRENFESKGYR
ncbi:MAG: orotate phosphoribosyltransferase, partial [bacterium]